MAEPAINDDRSLARYFFDQGYFACWADAMAALDAAPFKLTDAGLDRAWDVTPVARDDYVEFDARLALADAAPDLLAVAMGWECLHAEMVAAGGDCAELPAEHVERFAAIQLRLMDETRAAISKATSRQPEGER